MTYQRFEDLPVWKAAMDFTIAVFELLEDRAFDRCGDVRDQLQRAALSIGNNIAEGFERGSTAELLMFLYIGAARRVNRGASFDFANGFLDSATYSQGLQTSSNERSRFPGKSAVGPIVCKIRIFKVSGI